MYMKTKSLFLDRYGADKIKKNKNCSPEAIF